MPKLEAPIKLKWKTIQSIAGALGLNPVHVLLVSRGERQGRDDLLLAIEEEAGREMAEDDMAAGRPQ